MENKLERASLTICTVSFGHKELIEENMRLCNEVNLGADIRWVIVENTPKNSKERFEINESDQTRVLEGVENNFTGVGQSSQHHASGLNIAIREVKTRYALILDPDFYIVRKNWVREVTEYMNINNLAFFGAPYNPKRYLKYKYFPCIHCMFIDLEKIEKDNLDFKPKYQ